MASRLSTRLASSGLVASSSATISCARLTSRLGALPMTRPKVFSTPRIWFSRSQRIRTSRVRVASSARTMWLLSALMCTWRNHPVRTSWAMPAASLRSVFASITFRPALAWRASMQITGSPSARSSFQSQTDSGPVSRPIRSASGARRRRNAAMAPGSVAVTPSATSCRQHRPRRSPSSPAIRPTPRTASSLSPVRVAGTVIAAGRDYAKWCSSAVAKPLASAPTARWRAGGFAAVIDDAR